MRETEDHYFGAKGGKEWLTILHLMQKLLIEKKAFALPVISMKLSREEYKVLNSFHQRKVLNTLKLIPSHVKKSLKD